MIPIIIISINIPELDTLIQKYKGQKLTNDQVAELVSVACFVDENKVVQHNYNLNITDDLKELVSHYKTGGVAKQGRGVLDEYYTNTEIVDAVRNLLNNEIDKKNIDYSTINGNELEIETSFEIPAYKNQRMIIVDRTYDVDENDIGNTILHLTDENNILDSKTNTITLSEFRNKAFNIKPPFNVLEPSVGIGNFINAVQDLNVAINTFEINETTAKISKILHPEININLRSFESEFITENGRKRASFTYENRYDIVIGNPPYGQHRGMYKGLGEEPKLSRYEDYFVKRSLDTMKENGTLAMVLPSSWIDRQKKLNNAELVNAYRLPVGSFAGTQIGTDIVLLKKDSQKQNINISKYFDENPNKVLGEIREKTNRFGKLEEYVHGNLEEALALIEKDNLQKEETKLTPKIIEDYKKLYKEAIVGSDDWKYDVVNQNLNRFNQDIVFNNIFYEILEQNKELNADLYDKYHNDRKFALSFSNDVKVLCFKELQVKEKVISLDDIKSNKTYQEILKDSFGGVMYNEGNKTKYDEKGIIELSELWNKLSQNDKQNADVLVKGVVGFALEIKQDVIDKKQQKTTMPMWDEKTDTIIDVVPQEIAKEIKKKQSVQPSLFDNVEPTLSKEQIAEKEENNTQKQTLEATITALETLKNIKFKSPAIIDSIYKYENLIFDLKDENKSFKKEELEDFTKKAERIIKHHSKKSKKSEYQIQTEPKIKKGVLKYQFSKNDDIVNTSLQNSPNLTKEQIEAFELTEYNGTINIPNTKFRKYANYYRGEWKHDFYYAEGIGF